MYTEAVEITGHFIDSLLLPKILDDVVGHDTEFDIECLDVGRRKQDPSYARIRLTAKDADTLFAGNALAVHDIEYALFGASLGVYLDRGGHTRRTRPRKPHARYQYHP